METPDRDPDDEPVTRGQLRRAINLLGQLQLLSTMRLANQMSISPPDANVQEELNQVAAALDELNAELSGRTGS